jgi:hypothetical protein
LNKSRFCLDFHDFLVYSISIVAELSFLVRRVRISVDVDFLVSELFVFRLEVVETSPHHSFRCILLEHWPDGLVVVDVFLSLNRLLHSVQLVADSMLKRDELGDAEALKVHLPCSCSLPRFLNA